jgi:hypothetical protein
MRQPCGHLSKCDHDNVDNETNRNITDQKSGGPSMG